MSNNLFDRVWDLHKVGVLHNGQDQLFIGLHLIHEVTSPQAFQMLRERNLKVLFPHRTFATVDHIVPTLSQQRPFADTLAEEMMQAIERNTNEAGIQFFGLSTDKQGIVHIIGPELGLTQPGMTIACGDSHTSTHGAFGSIAFGVGTSQIRDILASQTMALSRPNVRKIDIRGMLRKGIGAKDLALKIIAQCGVNGGIGYAYEFVGEAITSLSMEARMTLCNMSIEGGARAGYISPDETTCAYLKGRQFAPPDSEFEQAKNYWKSIASTPTSSYDDEVVVEVASLAPMITWGINPGQAIQVTDAIPKLSDFDSAERESAQRAYDHMGFEPGSPIRGKKIDKAFIGSCTNGRISDLRDAAALLKGKKVSAHVDVLVVPGSMQVKKQAEAEGLDQIFKDSGCSWREAGCSMCLAMNPDKLVERQLCASSSNRNFIGRQGAVHGRTLLMSPIMVAAAAVAGEVVDVREMM